MRRCGSTRRPTSSSTWRTPASATAATSASGSATSRCDDVESDAPGILSPTPTGTRPGGALPTTSSAPTDRAAPAGERSRSRCGGSYSREYPFAWFGILCEAPPSAPELIYNHSDRGFALISQRTETMQRMYFQCEPDEDVDDWADERIWEELQARVGANGATLKEGPITSRTVLPFRSFVQRADAPRQAAAGRRRRPHRPAHRRQGPQPRTRRRAGAGRDARARASARATTGALDEYTGRALGRVWKAQHFSYWMTTMLHALPDASDFDVTPPDRGAVHGLIASRAGSTYLAEGYTGWPS